MHGLLEPSRWDDLRLFLTVLREGSFTGASRALRIEQSTVSRRVAALEETLEGVLFERTPSGLRSTELAERLRPHAERVETAVRGFAEEALRRERDVRGRVRLACTESMAVHVLLPHVLGDIRALHPKLDVDLVTGDVAVDLADREADLALRFFRPTAGDLVAKRIGSLSMGVLAHRDYAERRETHAAEALDWISLELPGTSTPHDAFLAKHVHAAPRMRTNSYLTQVEAVRAGLGVALLVRALMHVDPALVEFDLRLPPSRALELWLVAPRALRDVPRVAALWEFLEERLVALESWPWR